MVTLSTRSRWMIWAICILHCIVSSETQLETWWWPSARAETCCLSNKYSTTLLVVFWLYCLHLLIVPNTKGMSQLKIIKQCLNSGRDLRFPRGHEQLSALLFPAMWHHVVWFKCAKVWKHRAVSTFSAHDDKSEQTEIFITELDIFLPVLQFSIVKQV